SVFALLSYPATAWILFTLSTWIWHTPAFYERALVSRSWHYLEHACFFGTALLFWWPVVQPFPSRPRWPRWAMIPYLILADIQNTLLSALLSFSDHVLYAHYEATPRLWGIGALDDQHAAGVLMWVPGSLVYLFPVALIGAQLLFRSASIQKR